MQIVIEPQRIGVVGRNAGGEVEIRLRRQRRAIAQPPGIGRADGEAVTRRELGWIARIIEVHQRIAQVGIFAHQMRIIGGQTQVFDRANDGFDLHALHLERAIIGMGNTARAREILEILGRLVEQRDVQIQFIVEQAGLRTDFIIFGIFRLQRDGRVAIGIVDEAARFEALGIGRIHVDLFGRLELDREARREGIPGAAARCAHFAGETETGNGPCIRRRKGTIIDLLAIRRVATARDHGQIVGDFERRFTEHGQAADIAVLNARDVGDVGIAADAAGHGRSRQRAIEEDVGRRNIGRQEIGTYDIGEAARRRCEAHFLREAAVLDHLAAVEHRHDRPHRHVVVDRAAVVHAIAGDRRQRAAEQVEVAAQIAAAQPLAIG